MGSCRDGQVPGYHGRDRHGATSSLETPMKGETDYVVVPTGDYTIGLDRAVLERTDGAPLSREVRVEYLENSVPRHAVFLKKVSISRRLVSRGDFGGFIAETGYLTEAEKEGWGWTWRDGWVKAGGLNWRFPFGDRADEIYRENTVRLPVLQVSCNDAREYCRWLSGRMEWSVRLPTEAEWEVFAESMGSEPLEKTLSGEPFATEPLNTNLEFINALTKSIERVDCHPTGLLWEWTSDWFDAYPGGPSNREFGRVYKVLRGGSLMSDPVQKGREYRFRRCPTARSPFYGFRIAVE